MPALPGTPAAKNTNLGSKALQRYKSYAKSPSTEEVKSRRSTRFTAETSLRGCIEFDTRERASDAVRARLVRFASHPCPSP